MRYVNLPDSSLQVSQIGMGCYAASGVYGEFDEEDFIRLLRLAHDSGVTLYDTADQYGDGERILGEAVRPFRNEVVIATKVGLTPEGGRDSSPEHIIRSCEKSLNRLGTDHIDLYGIHFDDPETTVAETVGALQTLKEQGKIREYGVGHLPIERVKEYFREGSPAGCLVELNCVSSRSYHKLAEVASGSAGIIGFSPTARGLLTGNITSGVRFAEGDIRAMDPLFWGKRLESGLRVVKHLRSMASPARSTPVQLAIRWAIERPEVASVLTGTTCKNHLLENLGAAEISWDKSTENRINEVLREEETFLQEELPGEIEDILQTQEYADSPDAIRSLVYVMENATTMGWIQEKEILPLFASLWRMRSSGFDQQQLDSVRQSLVSLLQL